MSPFVFLITRKTKNSVKEFFRRPSKIFFALFIFFFLGFSFYSSYKSNPSVTFFRDKAEFFAIIFALYTYTFFMTAKNGFINGASMFSMADVNLLFTAPFKEKNILTFGLFQQLSKSLTLGLFLLFQSSLVRSTYGLHASSLIVVLIGYGAVVFSGQMTATIIYVLTCSDDKKVLKAKVAFYGIFFLFFGVLIYNTFISGPSIESLVTASREKIMYLFPISGYISFTVQGAIENSSGYVISGTVIFILIFLAFYLLLSKIKKDFYEDVLKATQISFSAITARKEGKSVETAPRNVKTGKIGLGKGFGASAITYKHKKENRRSNPFFISPVSLVMAGFSFVYTFMFSEESIALFIINVYTMSMTVCIGRWAKEFTYPYIYLIPESNFKKLLFLLKAELPLLIVESIVCFSPLLFLGSYEIIEVSAMILARFTFGLLYIGVNLILQRFSGDSEKKFLTVIVYFLLAVLFSIPSASAGFITVMMFPFNYEIAFAFMSVINSVISLLLIYICRNVLEYSEFNNK